MQADAAAPRRHRGTKNNRPVRARNGPASDYGDVAAGSEGELLRHTAAASRHCYTAPRVAAVAIPPSAKAARSLSDPPPREKRARGISLGVGRSVGRSVSQSVSERHRRRRAFYELRSRRLCCLVDKLRNISPGNYNIIVFDCNFDGGFFFFFFFFVVYSRQTRSFHFAFSQ